MTEEQRKQAWERGKNALERIMKHVSVEKVEKLADKIEDPDFRDSMAFKIFIKNLK